MSPTAQTNTPPSRRPPARTPAPPRPGVVYQPAHAVLICVAAPALAISTEQGQLTGQGLEGFYHGGRRVLSRCQLRLAGEEPVPLQGRMLGAGRARFIAAARTTADTGPDPAVTVERVRCADGTERITVLSAAEHPVRLPAELRLGTDLAELGAIAVGRSGAELPAAVHGAGLRWSAPTGQAVVTAQPAPDTTWASAGLLRWELELPPGGSRTITLSIGLRKTAGAVAAPQARTPAALPGPPLDAAAAPWPRSQARCDDARVDTLLRTSLDDLHALLLRDPVRPADVHLAAGVPWRCALAPAESLRAARTLLPLGTRLAAGTLRTLARSQLTGPGPDHGRIPGTLRNAGPHVPPSCTGIEATLLFPAVLAEARRWGLADSDIEPLLPAAERCLEWLRGAAKEGGYVPDPVPDGPLRCETQAQAHRAALLGSDLLDAFGRPGGEELREWAQALRQRFREDFWLDDRSGGRPAALRTADGSAMAHLSSTAVELLDTGLTDAGEYAVGLLDKVQTEQLARLLGGPSLDSGWGLRSLSTKEPGHNPFGHRSGAVRSQETATAVAALAAAGYEKEAASLLRGALDAAEVFGYRLPEMYAAEQRTAGSAPLPHPAACRPAAVAAAAAVQLLLALAGIRPDVPAGTVAVRPMSTAPLGAVQFTGLRVAEEPFSVRISRLGMGMVEEAPEGLQLGI
ncbi:glycogen debranching N-terminal domain-containing protein [Streptomyces gobiensis]|uniref:glycogen debranching N-terminal domain-containing protein n=1 Tax=Streptomyces gobiensis TaxID=2875706 RepID=UPI001E4FD72C|nr:glycogen debranching N-terminal domain-containing protein [Streptomyces gobiensis]UGY94028.1 glycogen debranching protein [Streptomyces gobiensis]